MSRTLCTNPRRLQGWVLGNDCIRQNEFWEKDSQVWKGLTVKKSLEILMSVATTFVHFVKLWFSQATSFLSNKDKKKTVMKLIFYDFECKTRTVNHRPLYCEGVDFSLNENLAQVYFKKINGFEDMDSISNVFIAVFTTTYAILKIIQLDQTFICKLPVFQHRLCNF